MHTSINWKTTQHFIFLFISILNLSIENSTVCRMECTENLSSYFPSSPSDQFHERFAVQRVRASISIRDFELCLNSGCHHHRGGGWCSSGQLSACTLHPPATISRLPSEILCLFRKLKENADSGKDLWFAAVTRKTPENCLVAVFSSVKRNTTQ